MLIRELEIPRRAFMVKIMARQYKTSLICEDCQNEMACVGYVFLNDGTKVFVHQCDKCQKHEGYPMSYPVNDFEEIHEEANQ